MTRPVNAAIINAMLQPNVKMFAAVEMLFDSGAVRLWTGVGGRTIDGAVYTGAGNLLGFAEIEEVGDMTAKSATVSLSINEPQMISLALTEPYQKRKARVLFGVRNLPHHIEMFSGRMSTLDILDDPVNGGSLTLTIESKLIELDQPISRRYTRESHLARFPGTDDTFFNYVRGLADRTVAFGRGEVGNNSDVW